MDETPVPFEHLDGYSYDITGSRTVSVHTDRSGWNKRQATLILYIFADEIQRIKPKIIFYGTAVPSGQIYAKENHLYHPGVTVEFKLTAYNNEELFMQWIEEFILTANQNDTFSYSSWLYRLITPLDTAVNGPFKQWLREESDQYMESSVVDDNILLVTDMTSQTNWCRPEARYIRIVHREPSY
ncbi:hypothetical protein F5884DRAFT_862549 [Xylogone sp. PMI_703]|nr:hypothetical protein F5884DRAFT_862549 [Xylogone sp. PMI_703]